MGLSLSPVSSEEDVLTIAEATQEYPEEWVVMRVTRRDSSGQPAEGVVLGHDRDKVAVRTKMAREKEFCVFFTGQSPIWVMI